jgi:hypothetical protein
LFEFTKINNNQADIPAEILELTRYLCFESHVIDFGAGEHEDMYLDFHASTYTRIDKSGVVYSGLDKDVIDFDDALKANQNSFGVVVVFFRSLSCLSTAGVRDVVRSITENISSIRRIIIYDYGINANKLDDYNIFETRRGKLHVKPAEWYDNDFIHYLPEQITAMFPAGDVSHFETSVPAYKNNQSPGFYWYWSSSDA